MRRAIPAAADRVEAQQTAVRRLRQEAPRTRDEIASPPVGWSPERVPPLRPVVAESALARSLRPAAVLKVGEPGRPPDALEVMSAEEGIELSQHLHDDAIVDPLKWEDLRPEGHREVSAGPATSLPGVRPRPD
jgi:hypothetical protein